MLLGGCGWRDAGYAPVDKGLTHHLWSRPEAVVLLPTPAHGPPKQPRPVPVQKGEEEALDGGELGGLKHHQVDVEAPKREESQCPEEAEEAEEAPDAADAK